MNASVLRVDPERPDARKIEAAAEVLRGGGTVAFPTETVYGLGADARSAAAVERIFAAKGRPADNPLIVHVDSLDAAELVAADVPALARELAGRWWPGPLTVVVAADPKLPRVTTGGLATVAVRMPAHPVALALLRAAGIPLAAPSANRSGRPSPTTAQHVLDDLGAEVDLVLDGGTCRLGLESTVVDARGARPVVLRDGAVTREQLGVPDDGPAPDSSASPGTRYRHYQPRCEVVVVAAGSGVQHATHLAAGGRTVGFLGFADAPPPVATIGVVRDADELGARLYRALRDAEVRGVDILVVESVPEVGIGRAVMDRLRRAAGDARF